MKNFEIEVFKTKVRIWIFDEAYDKMFLDILNSFNVKFTHSEIIKISDGINSCGSHKYILIRKDWEKVKHPFLEDDWMSFIRNNRIDDILKN